MMSRGGAVMRVGVALCLVMVVFPISAAQGLGPLAQNDAGSGRDAPNHISDEVTILPGVVYEGSTTGPGTDDADVYHLTGEAGQDLRARVDGALGCYDLLDTAGNGVGDGACSYTYATFGEPLVATLPYTGDYYLRLAHLAPAAYTFAFNLSGSVPDVRAVNRLVPGGPLAQNDAGSGRDAPNHISDEVTILPGVVYEGSATGPGTDDTDVYHLTGEAGQDLRARVDGFLGCYYLFDAEGNQVGSGACGTSYVPRADSLVGSLPYTGDYFLELSHVAPAFYTFAFNLSGPVPEFRLVPGLLGADDPPTQGEPLPMPDGCDRDFEYVPGDLTEVPRFTDDCYHMRTGLNGLDTPKIDVLLVPPVSMYPERDLRTMREAIEMWDEGIQTLAPQLGMQWLADGVDIDIFVDDDQLRTDPLWDPEIVVVASNPVGGAGIGVDPPRHVFGLSGPCHGQPNPLAGFEDWLRLPGFDDHHDNKSGTYTEDCPGGGNICYAVNGAIDPAPGVIDFFALFDLVAHEVGHCLTIGHVGDARDHKAEAVPFADIMSYTNQAHDKCVSTLDVESFAITMSRFLLDVPFAANDPNGPGSPFHIQHPDDHWYASPTGLAKDCPPPDTSVLPGGDPEVFEQQDDAGSGHDAPGANVPDITIEPGVLYEASSTGILTDDRDTYHFRAVAGQTFTGFAYGSTACYGLQNDQGEYMGTGACNRPGGIEDPLQPGPVSGTLPYTGDYYYWIGNTAPANYTFEFTLEG